MTPQCLGREKELVPQRGEIWNMPCYNLHRRWNLSINVGDWNPLLMSLYLRFAFRVCIFLLCVILAGPHFATLHFRIRINLFSLISVLEHSKFLQISSHCDNQWRRQMICNSAIKTVIITMIMMMMMMMMIGFLTENETCLVDFLISKQTLTPGEKIPNSY